MYDRIYNFSAGPATMPVEVLEEIRDELLNYRGSGMSVMEMSHRSKVFQEIYDQAEANLRKLMAIPHNYKVLFIQGGATLQFSMLPMNLMPHGAAEYIVTGGWSKKAFTEAKKFGDVRCIATSGTTPTSPTAPICPSARKRTTCTSAKTKPSTAPPTRRCPTPKGKS